MKKKYLPLGSIVKVKKVFQLLMITGFIYIDDKEIFDYSACVYPVGIISKEKIILFNHEDIEKVIFEGYNDEKGQEFQKILKATTPKVSKTLQENVNKNK